MENLNSWEPTLRLFAFTVSLFLFAMLEVGLTCRPRRPLREHVPNIVLLVTNTTLIRLIPMTSLVGLGFYVSESSIGLTNLLTLPFWLALTVAFVALDFVTYLQHRLLHWVPLLWRMHRVHHSDPNFDLSTGVRFHPGEILLSYALKAGAILLLGASAEAVICYEIALSSSALFTHANVRFPPIFDRALRYAIVTPDMHRIHHSVDSVEHNHNFGFFLVFWDRVLGSYMNHPKSSPELMDIGLHGFPRPGSLPNLLTHPMSRAAMRAEEADGND